MAKKTRISVSISKELLERLDKEVDGINVFSRSEAIDKIIKKYVSEKKKCVILAGGNPKNLFVRELKTYRPLVKIGNRTLIEDIIEKAKKTGYSDIIVVGSKEVLSVIYNKIGDGKSLNVDITYLEEKEHLGSGKTLDLVRNKIKNTFLFVPCDHYFNINLGEMENYHKRNNGVATLVVYSGTEDEWKKTSIVELEGNKIKSYVENPKDIKTHLTALMIGFAEPSIFDYIPAGRISWSLQENIFSELAKKGLLVGYIYSGKWKNIHTKKDLESI